MFDPRCPSFTDPVTGRDNRWFAVPDAYRNIAYPLVKAGQICGFMEDMDGGGEEPEDEDPE